MAYWFLLRFGEGAAAIGPVMAAGLVLASASVLWTGWLTRRLGTVRAVVVMRLAELVLFELLPLAPSYPLASFCYVLIVTRAWTATKIADFRRSERRPSTHLCRSAAALDRKFRHANRSEVELTTSASVLPPKFVAFRDERRG